MKRAAIALAAFAIACVSPSEPVVPIAAELTAFTLEAARNPALSADVPGVIVGDTVLLVIPEVVPVDALVPTFVTREAVTTVEVRPGEVTRLTYKAPWIVFLPGKLKLS